MPQQKELLRHQIVDHHKIIMLPYITFFPENFECGPSLFKCRKSYCINETGVCDHDPQCLIALTDEEMCGQCCSAELKQLFFSNARRDIQWLWGFFNDSNQILF